MHRTLHDVQAVRVYLKSAASFRQSDSLFVLQMVRLLIDSLFLSGFISSFPRPVIIGARLLLFWSRPIPPSVLALFGLFSRMLLFMFVRLLPGFLFIIYRVDVCASAWGLSKFLKSQIFRKESSCLENAWFPSGNFLASLQHYHF